VQDGIIKINDLIIQERIDEIEHAVSELDTTLLSPVKEYLGDDFSYPEIRYVMAWIKHKNSVDN